MIVPEMPEPVWQHPPANLTLTEDDVHIWRAFLDLSDAWIERLRCTLDPDEKRKAERFRFPKDRVRFIAAHGALREILSRYLQVKPDRLRFRYSPYGKPDLGEGFDGERIRFNLSDSDGLAICAVTRGREIGIDLERVRAGFAEEHIAEQFFSPREVSVLRSLPKDVQAEAFFNCWTRKEAYIKARGEGLSLPLDQFDVSLVPGELAMLISTLGDPSEASRWSLAALSPGPGYVAALAVEGHSWRLACWQWL